MWNNDKALITVSVTILGIAGYVWSYMTNISAENIITAIVSGLFGMGTGAALTRAAMATRSTDPTPGPKEG
jgi:hypothetical protein